MSRKRFLWLILLYLFFLFDGRVAAAILPQMTGGSGFNVVLKPDGTVWTIGRNEFGQLGIGSNINSQKFVMIPKTSFNNEKVVKIISISIGTMAVTETNKVYFWGEQINTPFMMYNNLPVLDISMTGIGQETQWQSTYHVLTNDGYVRNAGFAMNATYGNGIYSQNSPLGNCTAALSLVKTNLSTVTLSSATLSSCPSNPGENQITSSTPLSNVVQIASNNRYWDTLALNSSNVMYGWGKALSYLPKAFLNPSNLPIKKIQYGKYPTFLTTDGRVFYYPTINSNPVQISLQGTSNLATDIVGNGDNLLILDSSGTVFGVGPNTYGQLGVNVPIDANGAPWTNNIAINLGITNAAHIGVGFDTSLIWMQNNTVQIMGRNGYGEMGRPDTNASPLFIKNPLLSNTKDILALFFNSYSVDSTNKLYGWGYAGGNASISSSTSWNQPGVVKDFSGISPVTALRGWAYDTTRAGVLLQNTDIYSFGDNWEKAMGVSARGANGFTKVINTNGSIAGNTFNFIDYMQDYNGGMALASDGKVYTWGLDNGNALGLGYDAIRIVNGFSQVDSLYAFQPISFNYPEPINNVFGKRGVRFILTSSGKVYAWGQNDSYRTGSTTNYKVPTFINTLPAIQQIAPGREHTLFLANDGTVWSAGMNLFGQLGLGHSNTNTLPVQIPGLTNIVSVFAGDYSSFAIDINGDVWSWGDNRYGQLGLGDTVQRNSPRKINGISSVKKVSGSAQHSILLLQNGDVYVTGNDANGQLGLNHTLSNPVPNTVDFPPQVNFSTSQNGVYNDTQNLTIQGNVEMGTVGNTVNITYTIEGPNGTSASNALLTYTSNATPQNFSLPITFSGYPTGAYIVRFTVSTDTGSTNTLPFYFTVADNIAPTINFSPSSVPKWSFVPIPVDLSITDAGGSGFRDYRYQWSTSTVLPSSWTSLIPIANDRRWQNSSGIWYLHVEAYDKIGNRTYAMGGPYHVDLENYGFTFTASNPLFSFPTHTLGSGTMIHPSSVGSPLLTISNDSVTSPEYHVNVTMSQFTSPDGNPFSASLKMDNLNGRNGASSLFTIPSITIDNSSKLLYSSSSSTVNLNVLSSDVTLEIPPIIRLLNSSASFTSTMNWTISLGP